MFAASVHIRSKDTYDTWLDDAQLNVDVSVEKEELLRPATVLWKQILVPVRIQEWS